MGTGARLAEASQSNVVKCVQCARKALHIHATKSRLRNLHADQYRQSTGERSVPVNFPYKFRGSTLMARPTSARLEPLRLFFSGPWLLLFGREKRSRRFVAAR